jgi:CheY-like chemotaxis protein
MILPIFFTNYSFFESMKSRDEIVLIEDDEDNAQQIIANLQGNFAAHIRHFEDGAAALNFLFSDEGDSTMLILLDLTLPSVDGVEILKRMKADPFRKDIPIVVLIASVHTKDYVDSLGLHPEGYANKRSRTGDSA